MNKKSKLVPINLDEQMTVLIEGVGSKGDGIAKKQGFVIIVPDTKKGDIVKIKITRIMPNMAFAKVIPYL